MSKEHNEVERVRKTLLRDLFSLCAHCFAPPSVARKIIEEMDNEKIREIGKLETSKRLAAAEQMLADKGYLGLY